MNNNHEVWQLCNKTEFVVFKIKNITEKYCDLVSVEEVTKAQEKLGFWISYLENIDKASKADFEASTTKKKLNPINFAIINI